MHSRQSGVSDPGLHSGHSVTKSRSTKCQEKSSASQLATVGGFILSMATKCRLRPWTDGG
jgi:hypothetical protein